MHGKVYCAGFSVKKGFGTFVDSRARGLGFAVRVQGVEFRVPGVEFRVLDSGFTVESSGFRTSVSGDCRV